MSSNSETENTSFEDTRFQALLQDYAAPVADNGFTAATLTRINSRSHLRKPILVAATLIGGLIAISQTPSLLQAMEAFALPEVQPLILTTLGLLGFVGWAALDRGWSDAV